MKYSYNWLKELSGTKKNPEKLAETLMMHAFEVESLESTVPQLDKVVVGQILSLEKHPNADRLQLVKVKVTNETLEIVCGAWNIKIGDKVPVALAGAKLPSGIVIREAEVRGIKSHGMLCAEDELGLGIDHSGILILKKSAKLGRPVMEYLVQADVIMDIKVLPNRSHDALSHVGMAREIAALDHAELDYDYDGLKLPAKKTKKLSIEIKDKKLCRRYIGAVMENIEIGESPEWLKSRLAACGIRSISNVVDVTNLVMLELGQPMHAFDYDVVKEQSSGTKNKAQIIVRTAKQGEKITLLDDSVKTLDQHDLLITSPKNILGIAGVMGGKYSGISEKTKTIVLEAATFHPTSVRLTANRHNARTDAAALFEKDLDPNLAEKALVRSIELLEKVAKGKLEGILDIYPKKISPWTIVLDVGYVSQLLGVSIPKKEIEQILKRLQLKVKPLRKKIIKGKTKQAKEHWIVTIPTFRIDLENQEDLIEEIGRTFGYEKIPSVAPLANVQSTPLNELRKFERLIKDTLVANGFSEVYAYSFYGREWAENVGLGSVEHIEVANPMNPDQLWMRQSLIPGMLTAVRENLKQFDDFRMFELGRVYLLNNKGKAQECKMLVGTVVMKKTSKRAEEFFEAKGYCDALFSRLGIEDAYYDTFDPVSINEPENVWHEGRSAAIKLEGQNDSLGFLGEIHPVVLEKFGISQRVALFEIDVEKLRLGAEQEREYQPIRKHPIATRDIALTVSKDNETKVDDVLELIQSVGGEIVIDVDLFDVFELSEDEGTSFAFHITFGADDRTLQSVEVDKAMDAIVQKLEVDLGLQVRK